MLGTALLSLAGVVLLLVVSLGGLVTSEAGDGTTDGARHTVSHTGAEVAELALGLLLLTLEVLFTARLLQRLLCLVLAYHPSPLLWNTGLI